MKKLIALFILGFTLISCEKNIGGVMIDANVDLAFRDAKGADLLNPLASNAIKDGDLEVFVLKNGIKTRYYQANLDAPKSFKIFKEGDSPYVMRFYFDVLEENFNGSQVTQYLRYKDGSEDILVAEFNSNRKSNKIIQKVWINGVLRWSAGDGNATIVVIK